jgi:hypothetical protein
MAFKKLFSVAFFAYLKIMMQMRMIEEHKALLKAKFRMIYDANESLD